MFVMDIFFFYGVAGKKEPYLLSVESRTGHLLVSRMANKTVSSLLAAIHRYLNYYKGHGYVVETIRTDRETSLLACEPDLLARGVTMQRTGTASHAKQAERAIQTVKSRCRATKSSLGFNLPHSLHQYLVMAPSMIALIQTALPLLQISPSLARGLLSVIITAFPSEQSASSRLHPIESAMTNFVLLLPCVLDGIVLLKRL